MKVGDLVKCDYWVHDGKSGIVVGVQPGSWCVGAYVLLECGFLKLVRIENLEIINEGR